ncbi:MAG TPA: AsnC family protein [Kiloniellales bacterium]|nr:AsnC family protein [Kiloniellales bacterium]
MELIDTDLRLAAALVEGLPFDPQPYARLARELGLGEAELIARTRRLLVTGVVTRFGVIVRHRPLGYRANAMVVWDLPDAQVRCIGQQMAALPYVTLCYSRQRRPPTWPYNLFCMIHGRERTAVQDLIEQAAIACGIADAPREMLFSQRCFKQRGARYLSARYASGRDTEAA